MTQSFDFESVDRITAGAVGEPGERTFYVQARSGAEHVTLLAEKEQVGALGQALVRLLETISEDEEGAGDEGLDLEEPLDAVWRVGSMQIEYDEDADRVTIVLNELLTEEEAEEREAARARFVVTRDQVRAMASHALEVVAAGRPRCQLCGNPIEVDGEHTCPTMNGHRRFGG